MTESTKLILQDSPDEQHYSIRHVLYPITYLKKMFEHGPDEMNFVLFSTSGVHGTYSTIEDEEKINSDERSGVTFLIVQPRLVALKYGNVIAETEEDIAFLKKLRKESLESVMTIG